MLIIKSIFNSNTSAILSNGLKISIYFQNDCSQNLYELIKDWQALIASIIIIIGWFVNSWLNRNTEISKRLLEHRLTALKSVVEDIIFEISKNGANAFLKPDFKEKLERSRATIQMYGYINEIKIYEEFIDALNMKSDTEEEKTKRLNRVNKCLEKLPTIVDSLRKELGLKIIKKSKSNTTYK